MAGTKRYNITLKNQDATPEEVAAEKKKVESHGGKVIDTFSLIKGFTVEFPADRISTLEADDKLDVEADSEVHTQ